MSTLNKIKNAFNKSKTSYDLHSSLQNHVGDQLIQLLLAVAHKEKLPRIIDLGCGTGTVTQQLINKIPLSELHAIDIADSLLQIAKSRLLGNNIHVYNRAFDQPSRANVFFDIAFSNMALHWSEDFETTLHALHQQLNKHGLLVFSVPLPGTLAELKPHFSVNELTDAKVISNILSHLGYDVLAQQTENILFSFPDTLAALKSIKQVGANAVKSNQQNRLSGKSLTNKVDIRQLTYKIGYFLARKMEHPCQPKYSLPVQTRISEKPILVSDY